MREYGYILPKTYRKFGWFFLLVAVTVFLLTVYISFTKLTISILPMTDNANRVFEISIANNQGAVDVEGFVEQIEISGSKQFQATGEERVASDNVGKVNIINNHNQSQTLVATTRLAAADNPEKILLRLRDTVTVNPGQTVEVVVYAADQGAFDVLIPQKFIIPGLRAGLREQIYAQNNEVLSVDGILVKVISDNDISQSREIVEQELLQKAQLQFNHRLADKKDSLIILSNSQVINFGTNHQAKEQFDYFEATATLSFEAVAFDEKMLADHIAALLQEKDDNKNEQQIAINPKQLSYQLKNISSDRAVLEVQLNVDPILYAVDLFDKTKLIGLSRGEIVNLFKSIPGVADVRLKFRPWWAKTAPKDINRIKLEINY